MAPPKKQTRCYSIRLSPARHAAWKAAASSRGMSFSEYVTARVEGGGPVTITGDFQAAPKESGPILLGVATGKMAPGPLAAQPAITEAEAALADHLRLHAELAGMQSFADAPVVKVEPPPPPPRRTKGKHR